jgi:hypothetical protein
MSLDRLIYMYAENLALFWLNYLEIDQLVTCNRHLNKGEDAKDKNAATTKPNQNKSP